MSLNFEKLPKHLRSILEEQGLDEFTSVDTAFDAWLRYEGIIGYTTKILAVLSELRAADNNDVVARLQRDGVAFEVKNNGYHLVVEDRDSFVDYWPTTGRWIARSGGRGIGYKSLIEWLGRPS